MLQYTVILINYVLIKIKSVVILLSNSKAKIHQRKPRQTDSPAKRASNARASSQSF